MKFREPEVSELYVFFHNMETRDVDFFDIFLVGTNKKVSVDKFLKTLHECGYCSSFFIKKFFEKYTNRNDIYFDNNIIKTIMKFETYDFKEAKDCFIYMLSNFIKIEIDKNSSFSDFFINVLDYMTRLRKDEARNDYELTADVSPIFYTSYRDIKNIPVFVKNYILSVEREDEDMILEETVEGVALSSYKREDVEEILESLIDITDGLEHTLVLKLKKALGLNKRE